VTGRFAAAGFGLTMAGLGGTGAFWRGAGFGSAFGSEAGFGGGGAVTGLGGASFSTRGFATDGGGGVPSSFFVEDSASSSLTVREGSKIEAGWISPFGRSTNSLRHTGQLPFAGLEGVRPLKVALQ